MSTVPANRATETVRTLHATAPGPRGRPWPWSTGRVNALVIGSVIALASLSALTVDLIALVIDQTQRDRDGFIETFSVRFDSNGYAIVALVLGVLG